MRQCGEDRVGGCLVQYLPPVMLSATLLTSAASSQTMDLSPGVTKGETSLANIVRPSCGAPAAVTALSLHLIHLNALPGSLEWEGCLSLQ